MNADGWGGVDDVVLVGLRCVDVWCRLCSCIKGHGRSLFLVWGWRRWWRYPPSSAYLCKVSQSSAVVAGHVVRRTLLSTALVESTSTTGACLCALSRLGSGAWLLDCLDGRVRQGTGGHIRSLLFGSLLSSAFANGCLEGKILLF